MSKAYIPFKSTDQFGRIINSRYNNYFLMTEGRSISHLEYTCYVRKEKEQKYITRKLACVDYYVNFDSDVNGDGRTPETAWNSFKSFIDEYDYVFYPPMKCITWDYGCSDCIGILIHCSGTCRDHLRLFNERGYGNIIRNLWLTDLNLEIESNHTSFEDWTELQCGIINSNINIISKDSLDKRYGKIGFHASLIVNSNINYSHSGWGGDKYSSACRISVNAYNCTFNIKNKSPVYGAVGYGDSPTIELYNNGLEYTNWRDMDRYWYLEDVSNSKIVIDGHNRVSLQGLLECKVDVICPMRSTIPNGDGLVDEVGSISLGWTYNSAINVKVKHITKHHPEITDYAQNVSSRFSVDSYGPFVNSVFTLKHMNGFMQPLDGKPVTHDGGYGGGSASIFFGIDWGGNIENSTINIPQLPHIKTGQGTDGVFSGWWNCYNSGGGSAGSLGVGWGSLVPPHTINASGFAALSYIPPLDSTGPCCNEVARYGRVYREDPPPIIKFYLDGKLMVEGKYTAPGQHIMPTYRESSRDKNCYILTGWNAPYEVPYPEPEIIDLKLSDFFEDAEIINSEINIG